MGLAEAGVAVDEKGVKGGAGVVRNGDGGGVGEFVGVADDKAVKGVARDLGQTVVLFGDALVIVQLVSREDDEVEGAGEKV